MNPLLAHWLNQHIWLDGCELETELLQARDEGCDVSSVEQEFARLLAIPKPDNQRFGGKRDAKWLREAQALLDKVQTLRQRAGYPYREPSDLTGIQAARPATVRLKPWRGGKAQFEDQLHGGLLGRMAGCMLGKPVEGWHRASN